MIIRLATLLSKNVLTKNPFSDFKGKCMLQNKYKYICDNMISGVEARRRPASKQEDQLPRCNQQPAALRWRCQIVD